MFCSGPRTPLIQALPSVSFRFAVPDQLATAAWMGELVSRSTLSGLVPSRPALGVFFLSTHVWLAGLLARRCYLAILSLCSSPKAEPEPVGAWVFVCPSIHLIINPSVRLSPLSPNPKKKKKKKKRVGSVSTDVSISSSPSPSRQPSPTLP
ncbi:hypothetical protein IWZ03DRAFT_385679, partial [Phyllosticta citriasiana]